MLEDAEGILKEKDENGNSVYEHLISVVQKVIESKTNCYEDLEQVSTSIKQQKREKKVLPQNDEENKELQGYISNSLKLCGKPESPKISEFEEEVEENNEEEEAIEIDATKVTNIMKNVQMLQWSGVNFCSDWWALQCACQQLAKHFPLIIEPRFFGKIFGLENDYWIVETKLEEYPEPQETDEPKMEKPGEGLNSFVYFVCTNLENCQWYQLPYLTPEAIIKSRECHIQLKGNLKAKIGGRYKFEGEEDLYLRCLIARISSSTMIAPVNYYTKEEESEDPLAFILNEEFTNPESIEINSWVHCRPHLRKDGRLSKYIEPEKEDGEEEENSPEAEEEEEEEISILRTCDSDEVSHFEKSTEEENYSTMWYIRHPSKQIMSPYEIGVMKNKLWPGAMTCFEIGTQNFLNIYVGDGCKFLNQPYQPQSTLPIMNEFNEFTEIPNPENEEEMIPNPESMFMEGVDPTPPPPVVEEEEAPAENAEENAAEEEAPAAEEN